MATAAQRRRYQAYRKKMYSRGKQKHILPIEDWIDTPKDQEVPTQPRAPKPERPPEASPCIKGAEEAEATPQETPEEPRKNKGGRPPGPGKKKPGKRAGATGGKIIPYEEE